MIKIHSSCLAVILALSGFLGSYPARAEAPARGEVATSSRSESQAASVVAGDPSGQAALALAFGVMLSRLAQAPDQPDAPADTQTGPGR